MKINVEFTEQDLKDMVLARMRREMPDADIQPENVMIEVKSTQNYKAEWEIAAFRARLVREL